jgi:small subunit ribosomal protein S18
MDCYFCQRNTNNIDFKNTEVLKNFVSSLGKIRPQKKTNFCSKHQRQLSTAVKKARHLGLLSTQSK